MKANFTIAVAAVALAAAPLSAQITRGGSPTTRPTSRTSTTQGGILGDILNSRTSSTRHDRIPPGQLPPRGMCRVWIDGVPPGQQPAVTDCTTAERERIRYGAGARVIYGDQQSFPGKGNGKFKQNKNKKARADQNCSSVDGVVVGGRVVNVCRDANGNIIRRDDRINRRGDDDEDDDDDRLERGGEDQHHFRRDR